MAKSFMCDIRLKTNDPLPSQTIKNPRSRASATSSFTRSPTKPITAFSVSAPEFHSLPSSTPSTPISYATSRAHRRALPKRRSLCKAKSTKNPKKGASQPRKKQIGHTILALSDGDVSDLFFSAYFYTPSPNSSFT